MGFRSVFLTQYMCFKSIPFFSVHWHRYTMPFRLSADPVVSTYAINRFNDGNPDPIGDPSIMG